MRDLTRPQPRRDTNLSMVSLLVLSATSLVPPLLLVWRSGGKVQDVGIISAASGLVPLHMLRG